MKKNRILLLAFVMFALGAAGAVLVLFLWDDRRFSATQAARLTEGMTADEVAAVLGGGPGDYTNGGPGTYRLVSPDGFVIEQLSVSPRAERMERCWCGPDGAIEVYFDDDGRLTHKWHYEPWPPRPPLWRRFLAQLSFEKK